MLVPTVDSSLLSVFPTGVITMTHRTLIALCLLAGVAGSLGGPTQQREEATGAVESTTVEMEEATPEKATEATAVKAAEATTEAVAEATAESEAEAEVADVQPKLTYSKETVAKLGEDSTLDCSVEGLDLKDSPNLYISWSKIDKERPVNSIPIASGDKVILLSTKFSVVVQDDAKVREGAKGQEGAKVQGGAHKSSLTISNVNEDDKGTYRCHIHFGEDQKIEADIPLKIEKAAYFTEDEIKTLIVTEGDAISIDCQPGGSPKPDVYWERLEDEIPFYGSKIYKSNHLELPLIERNHGGHYTCYADNGIGKPVSSKVILEVQFAPVLKLDKERVYTEMREDVSLQCQVEALPEAAVTWFKDGIEVLGTSITKVTNTPLEDKKGVVSTIRFTEVSADQLGAYTCKAENTVGKSERIATLQLKSPPVILKQSRGVLIYDTQKTRGRNAIPVVLECEAEGGPSPDYKWRKNGGTFVWQADPRFSQEEGTGNLLISDPTFEDNGLYQCIAHNELGTAVGDAVRLVNNTVIRFHGVDQDVYEMEAEIGRPFKMSCPQATGFPEPDLTWVKAYEPNKDGEASLEFVSSERMVVTISGEMMISSVMKEDESTDFKYVCLGSNELTPTDFSMGSVVNLKVVPPYDGNNNAEDDSLNIETFEMYTSPEEVEFKAGEENTLWCIYGGEPQPVVHWSRVDGKPLDLERTKTKNYGRTLVIRRTKMSDAGEYQCTAANSAGTPKTHTMKATVAMTPKFKADLASQTVEEGALVVFSCEAEASSKVEYHWYINGRPLKDMVATPRRTVDGSKLTIKGATKADIGNYACNVTSNIGYAYGQASLNVLPRDTPAGGSCFVTDALQTELKSLRDAVAALESKVKTYEESKNDARITLLERIAEKIGVPLDDQISEDPHAKKGQEEQKEQKMEEAMANDEEIATTLAPIRGI